MSVAALTTAQAYAPKSTQTLSFPGQLPLLFKVSFEVSFSFDNHHGQSLVIAGGSFPQLEESVFSIAALLIQSHLYIFYRMRDIHGHSDCS